MLRQYLHFCTSKASKMGTSTASKLSLCAINECFESGIAELKASCNGSFKASA